LQRDDLLRAYFGGPAWFAARSAVLGLAAAATSHLRSDESEKARSVPHEGCRARIPGRSTMTLGPAPGGKTGSEPGERVLRSDRETAWSADGRCGGRALLQRLQRQPDGGVELGIAARCPVVRRDLFEAGQRESADGELRRGRR
jgi:hypothetical protein